MRMDASVHPIVTRGIEVSEMLSDALYKEDWNMERDLIYYPVNVTPMYETMKNNKTFQSDLIYREKYHEEKFKNTFNQCDTAKYADDHKIKVRYYRFLRYDSYHMTHVKFRKFNVTPFTASNGMRNNVTNTQLQQSLWKWKESLH